MEEEAWVNVRVRRIQSAQAKPRLQVSFMANSQVHTVTLDVGDSHVNEAKRLLHVTVRPLSENYAYISLPGQEGQELLVHANRLYNRKKAEV